MICSIVPPYLLARIAEQQDGSFSRAAEAARRALAELPPVQQARAQARQAPAPHPGTAVVPSLRREVSDAGGTETLPGALVRAEGSGPSGDSSVDEAYEGLGATHALFSDVYGRSSVDGAGGVLAATVHYGRDYDNAFWDGERMVCGDGDGEVFERFTKSLTVIGHELAHGLIQYTSRFEYQDQAGALNESVSDVFGVLVEQKLLRQEAGDAAWLVGAGLFTAQVSGAALRSLKAPGTAYDDDVLGRDPQPATMAGYVSTTADNGGVHINSGIPNHAFYLAAVAMGSYAWERAGQIWYDTITEQTLPVDCTFSLFAAGTLLATEKRYGTSGPEYGAVADAWEAVGVRP
ncbi:M4 family metallopeptidase [Arthrobacter sp. zg-Y820]|uniref:M4 family metallopeptidase n=1 Tax=unclassified Arthrobacter TaxID=235627 RepID=UPI001E610486|nr:MULTISPECIES: M4 family metallopeptidase [unclassified Arthrobacter]MCC9197035.1 M4 family metallopeptidase [Arthrobacter sp. zg-Y820]MDK1279900.1 M4 family metallopeptidase [Arthrobacter sp. zg.Y820]WIB09202.1 M4 family metallopeptidase [Arthrobacter sp. zg-Y820]